MAGVGGELMAELGDIGRSSVMDAIFSDWAGSEGE